MEPRINLLLTFVLYIAQHPTYVVPGTLGGIKTAESHVVLTTVASSPWDISGSYLGLLTLYVNVNELMGDVSNKGAVTLPRKQWLYKVVATQSGHHDVIRLY